MVINLSFGISLKKKYTTNFHDMGIACRGLFIELTKYDRRYRAINNWARHSLAKFMGPTWGPSGADRTQVGPMLAPWILLSGDILNKMKTYVYIWENGKNIFILPINFKIYCNIHHDYNYHKHFDIWINFFLTASNNQYINENYQQHSSVIHHTDVFKIDLMTNDTDPQCTELRWLIIIKCWFSGILWSITDDFLFDIFATKHHLKQWWPRFWIHWLIFSLCSHINLRIKKIFSKFSDSNLFYYFSYRHW